MVLVVCNMDSMTALNQKHLGKGCSALFLPPSRLGMARAWLSSPKCHVGAADSVAPIGLQHPYTSEVCPHPAESHAALHEEINGRGGGGPAPCSVPSCQVLGARSSIPNSSALRKLLLYPARSPGCGTHSTWLCMMPPSVPCIPLALAPSPEVPQAVPRTHWVGTGWGC